jgi:hypothetical protein
LRKRNTSEDMLETEVQRFKEERRKNVKQEEADVREAMDRARANRPPDGTSDNEKDVERSDDEGVENNSSAARGRGRGSRGSARGATRGSTDGGPRGGRGRGSRGRGKNSSVEDTNVRNVKSIKDAFSVSFPSRSRPTASFV